MNTFTISKTLNKNKVFILQKNELEKRLDPFFYMPELLKLEKKVLAKKPKKLRDYVVSIASGSTPKRAEEEKYYAKKENGIPFLRVQNLSATGILKLEKVKYINTETHNGLLKRSQVSEGDLLVKITGVGRMAVASVAPKDFIGNINQHVCVIKTKNRKVSETLASFLNSNIGEKLASRRSTGGTRPALDYPALLSIPIIEDERILQIKKELVKQKTANEQKAKNLLGSIEEYLLYELEIELPIKSNNSINNRIFITTFKNITSQRFDPIFHRLNYESFINSILNSKYKTKNLKEITTFIDYGLMPTQDYAFSEDNGVPMIRVTNILKEGYIDMSKIKYIKFDTPKLYNKIVKENDILMVQCGNTTGKCAMVSKEFVGYTFGSFSFVIRANENIINQYFLFYLLNSNIIQEQLNRSITISSVRPNTSKPEVEKFLIPIPPKEKQDEIANHITAIRKQAQVLKDKTKELIIESNKEIEEILLG